MEITYILVYVLSALNSAIEKKVMANACPHSGFRCICVYLLALCGCVMGGSIQESSALPRALALQPMEEAASTPTRALVSRGGRHSA